MIVQYRLVVSCTRLIVGFTACLAVLFEVK